ncbi:P-loop containing nucleoside triphosphate hydrolase protein [Dioscorea alata]|uniref:P-loop containing nucleoside triphosphate hydrolase protein n=1 Tax=Dioscorea alata TaxID=55571 RepID=A0ACB7WM61_DIOAL|nr:P-loop containing nucleoside triphosphate hydrolase protein [Dioscorea alata]
MASATLSALAGSLLSPLREVSLEKLIGYLWDYLSSSPSPSSPDEAEKQQQLEHLLEALKGAKENVKSIQRDIIRLFKEHKQNETVVSLHNKLKDVDYDIQDLESEMKYMELERKVQEINKAEVEEADTSTTQSIRGLKRLIPFRRPTSSTSEKKRRLLTSSQFSSLSTDDEIVRKVTSITKQINCIELKLAAQIKLEEWFDRIKLNGVYDPREQHHFNQNKRVTTSSTNERKIYGRKDEIQRLIEFLKGPNVNDIVSVTPIVGMGGIGKTTLAQFVFNHIEIEDHFDNKAWIWVSDHFDRFRIIKQIVDSFCIGNAISSTVPCGNTNSLDLLERELRRHLRGKKFLLVLDDIWSDEWQLLLTPLQSAQAQAIKIIVTCRERMVLRNKDKENQINLGGIDGGEFWSLFLSCAFGGNNPINYSQKLHDIGKHIVKKLMGSPLAAKTVGKLLGRCLTEEHWNDVLENDLWKLKTDAHDIMPALALSYYHLPLHLQLCFAFCSVLPSHVYEPDEVICMWIANGYVPESGRSSKTMNDIGKEYYHELQEMGFFNANPIFVTMHDLMHDLAGLVSHGETCIYESESDKQISENVRHLRAKNRYLGLVHGTNNLRTLILYGTNGIPTFLNHGAFNKIRVLMIYDNIMEEFPDAIPHLKHLQYLTLWENKIKSIPDSLCGLYQLRALKLMPPQTLPSQFHSLINLEILRLTMEYPEELEYHVNKERGFTVAQLRNMNQLRGDLSILGLENIDNKEEVMKAKLKLKRHLKRLRLCWNNTVHGCEHNDIQEEVLEGLEPHPNLEVLEIKGYMGFKIPSWLMKLQKLKRICLSNCRNLPCLPAAVGLLHSLEELRLFDIENLAIECKPCDYSETEIFPSLQLLSLKNITVSFTGMPISSSSSSLTAPRQRKLFPRLQNLTVEKCNGVNEFPWPIYSTLKKLNIRNSPNLDDLLPECLHSLSSLTRLELRGAKIKTFAAEVMATLLALEELMLVDCNELLSVEGLQALPSLRLLFISQCPKFKSWCMEEMAKLHEICLTSCEDLESLPPWLHRLLLLKRLSITHCSKFRSLPEDGLPSSLVILNIIECDRGLIERCQQERSPEWLMIQHIPEQNYLS